MRVKGNTIYANANMVRADRPWDSPNVTISVLEKTPFRLQPGMVYYNNLRGWNNALLDTLVSTKPFMIRRAQDIYLRPKSFGEFRMSSLRRATFAEGASVTVLEGALSNNTLLNIMPFSAGDLTTTYTHATGRQLDVFGRSFYNVTDVMFIQNPNTTVVESRYTTIFTGISFGLAPFGLDGFAPEVGPLFIRGTLENTWNHSAYTPMWMYWQVSGQNWLSAALLCGSNYKDTVSDLSQPFVNVSTMVLNEYLDSFSVFPPLSLDS